VAFFIFTIQNQKPLIMHEGIVKNIDYREGRGFIQEKNGNLIMFLLSSVVGTAVQEEDKVTYELVENPTRQAVNVTKI
jgi:cold shock CspA family protein